MDEADSVKALSKILEAISESPYNLSLHAQHIRLALANGDNDQAQAAWEMLTAFWAAGDEVWLPLLEAKERSEDLSTPEGMQAVHALYRQSEQDYLSIPIMKKHAEFLIARVARASQTEMQPEDHETILSTTWTALLELAVESSSHLSQSHEVWDVVRDWQLEMLETASAEKKALLVPRVDLFFAERLKQPHSNNDETFQSYSSFTTNYKPPDEYEPILVAASKLRAGAVKTYQRREGSESSLVKTSNSLEAYAAYISSERRARTPDTVILSGVYERAIAEAAKRRFAGEAGAEEALRQFWIGYLDTLRRAEADVPAQASLFQRVLRSVPGSGEVWARYIRFLEHVMFSEEEGRPSLESSAEAYSKALATGLIQRDVEQIVPLVLARAGYEKRQLESGGAVEEAFLALVQTVEHGITLIREAAPNADPRFRLEKYLSGIYTSLAESPESAATVWELAAKHHKTSYLAWTSYTDVLIKQEKYTEARDVLKDISTKNLDWPEAIWEAWLTFEHIHGSMTDLEACMDKIERAQQQVNTRLAKEAEKAAYQAMQMAAETQAMLPSTTPQPPAARPPIATEPSAMDVDPTLDTNGGNKRKAEDDAAETHKRVKTESKPLPLKRDRENCTVFVADLPSGTTEDNLKALFKDCGVVREVKVTELPNALVATVEFMERDSVPAALTKDKKRVHEQEISVHMAWQSTLYITNFPEKMDDMAMRELFGKYGLIFDVRWPSKKFKSTRRFCYVQYVSPVSSKAALELHGQELEPGLQMNVYLSNPERKKERTDASANDKEIYVAGLSKYTNRVDLEKLFKTYGKVKEVRLATDQDGKSRGFAFVEFEEEKDALAALSANNHELKSRRIAVTLADTRVKGRKGDGVAESGLGRKADVRNRSVRVKNLPPGAQEGLLQQALEKHTTALKRVEVFADRNEAVVELENVAEAGKLLLLSEPIVFEGRTLTLTEDASERSAAARPGPSTRAGFLVPRTAGSRPKAGLGKPRAAPRAAPIPSIASGSAVPSLAPPAPSRKGQDHFREMLG